MQTVDVRRHRFVPRVLRPADHGPSASRRSTLRELAGRAALLFIWLAAEILVALERMFEFRAEPPRWA